MGCNIVSKSEMQKKVRLAIANLTFLLEKLCFFSASLIGAIQKLDYMVAVLRLVVLHQAVCKEQTAAGAASCNIVSLCGGNVRNFLVVNLTGKIIMRQVKGTA